MKDFWRIEPASPVLRGLRIFLTFTAAGLFIGGAVTSCWLEVAETREERAK